MYMHKHGRVAVILPSQPIHIQLEIMLIMIIMKVTMLMMKMIISHLFSSYEQHKHIHM